MSADFASIARARGLRNESPLRALALTGLIAGLAFITLWKLFHYVGASALPRLRPFLFVSQEPRRDQRPLGGVEAAVHTAAGEVP